MNDAREPLRRRCLVGRREIEPDDIAVFDLGLDKQGCLALVHALELLALEAGGEIRQVVGVLEQQVEALGAVDLLKLADDLGQTRRQFAHAGFSIGTRTALPHSTHEPS